MSVINKVLQDLDRRESAGQPAARSGPVRAVGPAPNGREWFWSIVAVLMVIVLAWLAWVFYQLRPRSLATPAAFVAAESAISRGTAPLAEAPSASATTPPAAPTPVPQPRQATAQRGELRMADVLSDPPAQPALLPAEKKVPPPKAPPTAEPATLAAMPEDGTRTKIERRDRAASPAERAEARFRQAVALLRQGRAADAEDGFAAALGEDVSHRASRQALVALHLERGQLEPARRLLEEGLRSDPAQPDFAVALARIAVERRDFAGALATLQATSGAEEHLDYQLLRATVLQRLERHGEASEAYQAALRLQGALPQGWVGLGISLEALGRRSEAAEAYRRSLAAGPTNAELRSFAEQRVRALR